MQTPASHMEKSSIATSPVLFDPIGRTSQVDANPPGTLMLRYFVTRSFKEIIVGLWWGDKSVHGCGPIVLKMIGRGGHGRRGLNFTNPQLIVGVAASAGLKPPVAPLGQQSRVKVGVCSS